MRELKEPCRSCKFLCGDTCAKGLPLEVSGSGKYKCSGYQECPTCDGCGICIGPFHMEMRIKKLGKYNLCGSCEMALKRKGYLHVKDNAFLFADGELMPISTQKMEEFFHGNRDAVRLEKELNLERFLAVVTEKENNDLPA